MFWTTDSSCGNRWFTNRAEDAQSWNCLTQWSLWDPVRQAILKNRGPEDFGPEIVWKRFLEACYWRIFLDGSCRIYIRCWASGWRQPHSSCTWSKASGNARSLRLMVRRRRSGHHMGLSIFWRWQLRCPREAQECAGRSEHRICICRDPREWICRCMGPSRLWRWQFRSWRSSQECAAGWGYTAGICCDPVRWVCGYMGRCKLWRWQLPSPARAQGR